MAISKLNFAITERRIWSVLFGLLALYVAARMGLFTLAAEVATPGGVVRLPNTFASVDHPFHVARAETLWREFSSGHLLRWMGQHQGGYPVEFYPLGEAWLELIIRALSLGTLLAQGAHTVAVILLFLLPGIAFVELARIDRFSPAVALLALVLHVSLPGSWYDGGYTELVQWGLVTNVAGTVAALLMFPALIRFLNLGNPRAAALAAALSAVAIYCNPRSMVGLGALGAGAWLVALWQGGVSVATLLRRLSLVALVGALLAAPELIALVRFRELYHFVRYSGYDSLASYASTTIGAAGFPVLVLGIAGIACAFAMRSRMASRSTAAALLVYVLVTIALAFVPAIGNAAAQLEPTRLMPLQRLLTLYLAAVAIWIALSWLAAKFTAQRDHPAATLTIALAMAILIVQTMPLPGPVPDPASRAIPDRSLYPVAMSAQPVQVDLERAIRATDVAAEPGTAILVVGSGLSWHQQLWAPLWTRRPLYYDNWLWYWHLSHVGTPGYQPDVGHHYPDPEQTLDATYLVRHGIGAVVVTGATRNVAARSPLLTPLQEGAYDAYLVDNPVTIVSFGANTAASLSIGNQRIVARSAQPAVPVIARVNWYPRWEATADGHAAPLNRRGDGYMEVADESPVSEVEFDYVVQSADWLARGLAAIGVVLLAWLGIGSRFNRKTGQRWYLEHPTEPAGASLKSGASEARVGDEAAPRGGQ